MEKTNCPLCGKEKSKYLWSKDNADYVQCVFCNLVYENPRLTSEELKNYYSQECYFHGNNISNTSGYTDYFSQSNLNINVEYFSILQQHIGRKEQISYLDIGCGPGTLVKLASENNWNAIGIEISKWAVNYAKHNGINVIENNLIDSKFPDEYFDLVSMFDVLEHLPNPTSCVGEIYRILKPCGIVVTETPNVDGFFAKYFYRQKSDIVKPRAHICLYSPSTALRLFQAAGFSKIDIETFPYCRRFTSGYFKSLIVSRLKPSSPNRQLTYDESMRIVAYK